MSYEDKVSGHYRRGDLVDGILAALRDAGVDTDNLTPEALAPVDHFHSRGLESTSELGNRLERAVGPGPDHRLLDLGSGLGGPARYLASRFGCRVTGVDLTPEFCLTAVRLSELTGLADRVTFRQGSVLDLPFDDNTFDAAYSQNVSMNISDKACFHAEAFRVLKPGGVLGLSEYCIGSGEPPLYPVPWAETPETSFLVTAAETTASLEAAGFDVFSVEDVTQRSRDFIARQRASAAPSPLGFHVIMGPRMKEMGANTARNVEEGRVIPLEVMARKP